jgi:hypothetical protein
MAKNEHGAMKVGLGLAAVAAAAGAYYFYGKNGSQHRKQLKGWMVKAQGEVMEKIEGLTDLTENSYYKVVSDVMAKYKNLKTVTPKELDSMAKELKGHWSMIKSQVMSSAKKSNTRKK